MKAWQLIEKGWCQNSFARDKFGRGVRINSREAVQFCAVGAIVRIYETPETALERLEKLTNLEGVREIGDWNDDPERTQAEVVETLKRADV